MSNEIFRESGGNSEVPINLPDNSMNSYDPAHASLQEEQGKEWESFDDPVRTIDENRIDQELQSKEWNRPHIGESGKFSLRRIVGKGGFGEVHEALQGSLNRIVAIKRLRRDVLARAREGGVRITGGLVQEFEREAIVSANLEHPNIMPVHELGTAEDGTPLIAMKFIRGNPWDKQIEEDFPLLKVDDFLAKHIPILVDVAQAVAFAHSRGVTHRDLKPSQVLVGSFGEVILTDWGLAVTHDPKRLNQFGQEIPEDLIPTLDTTRHPAGTPAFMAPEQASLRPEGIGPCTDVYLLGGTLYFLLTGKPPHNSEDSAKAFMMAALGEVKPIETAAGLRPWPEQLGVVAMEALEADIDKRTSSVELFISQLNDWLTGASGKRESEKLCRDASSLLPDLKDEYRDYAAVAIQLNRAAALWPDNPGLPRLRNHVHGRWADLARRSGDFALSRMQAEMVSDKERREELTNAVEASEKERKEKEHQRRKLAWAVRGLLAAILVFGGLFILRLQKQRAATAAAMKEATAARDETQDLAYFMLSDLAQSLAPIGDAEPMRRLASRVIDYYEQLPLERQTPDARFEQGRARQAFALAQIQFGNLESAVHELSRVDEIARNLVREDPVNGDYLTLALDSGTYSTAVAAFSGSFVKQRGLLVETLELASGSVRRATGQPVEFTEGDAGLIEQAEYAFSWANAPQGWRYRTAALTNWIGELLEQEGKYGLAKTAYSTGERMHTALYSERQTPNSQQRILENRLEQGRIEERRGNYRGALTIIAKAESSVLEYHEKDRLDARWIRGLALTRRFKCRVLGRMKQFGEAMIAANQSVEACRVLLDRDARNAIVRYDLSLALLNRALVFHSADDISEAEEDTREAYRLMIEVAGPDPEYRPWALHLTSCRRVFDMLSQEMISSGDLSGGERLRAEFQLDDMKLDVSSETWLLDGDFLFGSVY